MTFPHWLLTAFCSSIIVSPGLTEAPTTVSLSNTQTAADTKLDEILVDDRRDLRNVARDKYRHPKDTLKFFGVRPGLTLIEITPGAGWYAEILAPYLKGNGTYIAAVVKPPEDKEARSDMSGVGAKFAADSYSYGEARIVAFEKKKPVFGADESADMVLTFRNVHGWVRNGEAPFMFQAFFAVLKPGGVLGIEEHRATIGTRLEDADITGYLPEEYVIKLATDAGFTLAAKSEINANPKDTKDYPQGVWTLPPTFALGARDYERYAQIGESDRMTLKFVKPGPAQ